MSEKQFKLSSETLLQYQIMNNDTDLNENEVVDCLNELVIKCHMLEKENRELNSIKKFAERNGINIFLIEEAFRNCWNDNAKLIEENKQLKEQVQILKKEVRDLLHLCDVCDIQSHLSDECEEVLNDE